MQQSTTYYIDDQQQRQGSYSASTTQYVDRGSTSYPSTSYPSTSYPSAALASYTVGAAYPAGATYVDQQPATTRDIC